MKTIKYFGLLAAVCLVFSANALAQSEKEQTEKKVLLRVEALLQTIIAEKWDELYKFVVVHTNQKDKTTRYRMNISENADTEEIKKKVGDWFKRLYLLKKPGKSGTVRLDGKDETLAHISYMHEDLDGFNMVLVDGEWYYTLEW